MEFLVKASQLILSLSILIVLHELGHFVPAKLFKTRVEKFYLFFNPWFSIFKIKRGETEYGLGWLPLGGYVKISGMIDESMDKEQMSKPPEPYEFRAKPAWQRLIIMIGGVTVNLILGFLIYMMVLFVWGKDVLPMKNAKYGIHADSLLIAHGFKNGDHVISVDGEPVEDLMSLNRGILLRGKRNFVVEREGKKVEINLPQDIDYKIVESGAKNGVIFPRTPSIVDSVMAGNNAEKAGLKKGDSIVSINGVETIFHDQVVENIRKNKNKQIALTVYRNGEPKEISVKVSKEGTIGFEARSELKKFFKIEHKDYGFFEAIPAGFAFGGQTLSDYVVQLKFLFTKAGVRQIGGFGSIGSMFPASWDWHTFWLLTAFLSIVLAFMNILPIPALDGGHVIFLIYEMITGRAPKQRVLEIAQIVGMVLLLGLLLYANGNDILKLFS